jgi:hypothetical protein
VSAKFELAPLMAVQKRRVEQAMAEVRARNEKFRQRESERDAAYQRWEEGRAASRQEQEVQVQSISDLSTSFQRSAKGLSANGTGIGGDPQGRGLCAAGLVVGAQRREWWRIRIEEYWKTLAAAEQELAKARAAAAEAQLLYRRARAREDALATLAANWRSAQAVKSERAEEQIVEDLLANRYGA